MMPKMQKPDSPAPKDPIRIPTEGDADLLAARRKKMDEQTTQRQGRASTDLTADNSRPYSRTALG